MTFSRLGTSLPVMVSDTGEPSASEGAPGSGHRDDWATALTGKVEDGVSVLRDRTVEPVARAVRYIIFGLMSLIIAGLLGVLFAVVLVRVLDDYAFHRRVWVSYLIVAGIFGAIGLLLARLRHPRT